MTSISMKASRTRAGILVVALALVGGTGCITMAIVDNVQQKNRMREREETLRKKEEARQQSVARLTPLADAGDAASQTALVRELLAAPEPQQIDQGRVLALLSSAASKGYGPAQAMLGEALVTARIQTPTYRLVTVNPASVDRERGFQLLRQAATQACGHARFPSLPTYSAVRPLALLGAQLERWGHADEARVWRARSVLQCSEPGLENLSWTITSKNATPQARKDALTLILLTRETERIARAEAAMPAEEVAAARHEAEQLRRQVAQSEQQYPAPSRKEM